MFDNELMKGDKVVSISLSTEQWEKVKKFGKKKGYSASAVVRAFIKEGLEKYSGKK